MTVRLSPTQRAILDAAAARRDGTLTPLPSTVTMRGKNLERTLAALVRRGFATDTSTQRDDAVARPLEEASATSLVITPAGRAAAGDADVGAAELPSPDLRVPDTPLTLVPAPVPTPGGKLGVVLQVVAKAEGATIEEIAGATNWLRHTSRAALTRLRQRGFDIRSERVDGRRVYRLHTAA
jgi:Protein of unknown function (DUF3489)